ncbi:FAD-binding oxidoreductase [Liquorilactobacillus mali]|uniref:Ferric reductase n=1 Tax=Liquorilactobacillus mali KCTC 3596 = DSM 20444 TaxID=1046596 RepID=J1F5M4_9LACO|nr:FAD-binding oxidoreductase [Liquorilactobacillus mali]EJF01634.1 oxidoreductase, FAD/NAD-binding domain protein [Liquorilactobacillus mali KCTC 3596 = DSM 20444]KRN09097.1 ferric reductase [Liquorilactobacillus mali KCTC 3596 = DSM 20444]QFQ74409.1 iron reductase [Liquorilactobacillus mali]
MLRKIQYKLVLFWLSFFFVVPLPFIQTISAGLQGMAANEMLAIYSGVIAYAWMLAAVYLSTKPRWLDRLVGLPSIYQLHGIIAIAALGLAWLHKLGTHSAGLIKQTGDLALIILTGLIGYSLLFLAGWLISRFSLLSKFKKILEKVFKHEVTMLLHKLLLAAVILVFIHVQLIDYIRSITSFMIWFDGLSLLTALSYLKTKINWHGRKGQAELKLIQNHSLSARVRELTFGGRQSQQLNLQAGDFVFLSFPHISKLREPHPFSLVSLPDKNGKFKLTIRADGDFTDRLKTLKAGVTAKVTGGFGRYQAFIAEHDCTSNLVIITGGIGVTPLFSLIPNNLSHKIYLFYSAHHQTDLLYQHQLNQWNQHTNFTGFWQQGRFSDDFVLNHLPNDWQNHTLFLLSGPIPLIHHWEKLLGKTKVSSKNIFKEEFNW